MKPWLKDELDLFLTNGNDDQFVTALSKAVESLEFDYFAYGMCVPITPTKPQYRLVNNYPASWQERYLAESYFIQDPTVKHGMKSSLPLTWNRETFNDCQPFWEEAKSFGITWGWAQSCRLDCNMTGMLTLARSKSISELELKEKTPHLLWLNQIAQAVFNEAWREKFTLRDIKPLSPRETEVIKWCAEGKTSFEIAIILNISERTANFHIANIISKLNVNNKTAAAIRALQLGIV